MGWGAALGVSSAGMLGRWNAGTLERYFVV